MEILSQILGYLVEQHPEAITFFLVLGVLRSINKPLFALIHAYVEATPNKEDDQKLEQIESSKTYKTFCFVLDYLTSVKIKK